MILALLAAAATAAASPASTAQRPVAIASDPHIQIAKYDESGVIALQGYLGFQTTIQFDPGERIENVAIGDATGWQLTPNKRADVLFVKPIGRGPATNMTIITDRRTYTFMLTVAPANASPAKAAWVLRFRLPEPKLVYEVAPTPPPPPVTPEGKNVFYTSSGPAAILPTRVFDDGIRTYFAWADQAPVPAIFAVNADGSEAVVNFTMRDGYSVVQQTAGRFMLRLGGSLATVTSTPGTEKRLPAKTKEEKRHDG
ncbi:TrbG/VirB9 family P-type conjugative transfer protein [Sphingomonas nostoxanthinifaciens]|uniref:TrbG/VirB9 family P-type conjugative transfer protein n=1 Tax=Sphingomonas nostoxanthinifaciens TaxID=2872652 RepID=UPI001CC1CDF9|nr:TrbG/VirB9 family P-type conjugative transfer protein [Sphingomonas nostoxanthinifaciens]UAK23258.1 TrbG/VirB9 family P-type conjugative transfer protein [Sphingomonas nostoxanthinifaciens]